MGFNPTKNPLDIVRLAFYLGALTDGLAVLPMLFPSIGIALFGGDPAQMTNAYRYAMGIGSSLMIGWTVILIWGALKPVERRAILLITVFPVVVGIVASSMYAVSVGLVLFDRVIYLYVHLSIVSAFFIWSYFIANKCAYEKERRA